MPKYYVRIGSLAEVHVGFSDGPLTSGRRVIVRTARGVELGAISAPITRAGQDRLATARILRPTSEQDELLLRRLERHKQRAVEACRDALQASGSSATVLDIDLVFDGATLVIHFLGPVDPHDRELTEQIATRYESIIRSRHFAKLLQDGCGPECGTSGAGCSSGGCSSCGLAAACQTSS
jgi:cell fate regulator YaaT (PSP1 superfamily)